MPQKAVQTAVSMPLRIRPAPMARLNLFLPVKKLA
jgi:hypothetical protein